MKKTELMLDDGLCVRVYKCMLWEMMVMVAGGIYSFGGESDLGVCTFFSKKSTQFSTFLYVELPVHPLVRSGRIKVVLHSIQGC